MILTNSFFAKKSESYNTIEKKIYFGRYVSSIDSRYKLKKEAVVQIEPLSFFYCNNFIKKHIVISKPSEAMLPVIIKEEIPAVQKMVMQNKILKKMFKQFCNDLSVYVAGVAHDTVDRIEKLFERYRKSIAEQSPFFINNKYKNEVAYVRQENSLCNQEKEYLKNRMPRVKKALELFLEISLDEAEVPKIACVCSGGGIRSLIAMTGFHEALDDISLLDAIIYDVGLSGGAWFNMLWYYSNQSIKLFRENLQEIVLQDLRFESRKEVGLFFNTLLVRFGLKQPVTLVNSWGALLANRYLSSYKKTRQQLLWSDVTEYIKDGSKPLPIVAATSGHLVESFENRPKIPWYAFTPFEAECTGDYLQHASIPMWAVGRKFKKGVSVDTHPGVDLGLLMGICGSAFACSFARGYDKKIKDIPILGALGDYLLSKIDAAMIAQKRFSVGKIHNFADGISSSQENLTIVDGGLAFNLPYPPVSGHGPRKADIYFFFDASNNVEKKGSKNLYMIQKYAQEHNILFPSIDNIQTSPKSITVFKDLSNPEMPLVFYIPRSVIESIAYPLSVDISMPTSYSTIKFAYTKKEFEHLHLVAYSNLVFNKEKIKKEIRSYLDKKYSK